MSDASPPLDNSETPLFQKPVLWIKIPKCAGSSLRHLLLKEDLLYLVNDPETISMESLQKAGTRQVLQIRHGQLHVLHKRFPEWVEQTLIFVIVRNPRDRFVSGWRYCPSTRLRSFNDVVRHPPKKNEHLQDWHHMMKPMVDFVCTEAGTPLMHYVVHMENIQKELHPVLEKIGIPNARLAKMNPTKHADFRAYYNRRNWERVGEIFARDIELFGYTAAPPPLSPASLWERIRIHAVILCRKILLRTTRQPE